jgi:hypothetical protein
MDRQNIRLIQQFYEVLEQIETKIGGKQTLANCDGRMPERGVYFFFEPGEERTTTGSGLRVVRVGTHGLRKNGNANLWGRLRQHRGNVGGRNPGGGNHRGSVFRKHLGTALINRDNWPRGIAETWGVGSNVPRPIKDAEIPLEREVSKYIGSMPFIWLEIDDAPGPDSLRGYIERNSIALLSNYHRENNPIDPPSKSWLGQRAKSSKVRQSGLWNFNHVDEAFDDYFFDVLNRMI